MIYEILWDLKALGFTYVFWSIRYGSTARLGPERFQEGLKELLGKLSFLGLVTIWPKVASRIVRKEATVLSKDNGETVYKESLHVN